MFQLTEIHVASQIVAEHTTANSHSIISLQWELFSRAWTE